MKSIFKSILLLGASSLLLISCGGSNSGETSNADLVKRVDSFLVAYNNTYRQLNIAANDGQWTLLTHIVKGDTMSSYLAQKSGNELAAFLGSADNIKLTQEFLAQRIN
jgi:hypothetical protein